MNQKTAQKILNEVKRSFEKIAKDFSSTRKHFWPEFDHIAAYINHGDNLLDIGCGNGRFAQFLQNKQINYFGLDISKKLLKIAKKNVPQGNFFQADMTSLPFPDHTFDQIVMIASFHHIPSIKLRQKTLQECYRVLKNKGLIFILVWNLYQAKFKSAFQEALKRSSLSSGNYSKKDLFIPWKKNHNLNRYYYAFTLPELKKLLVSKKFIIHDFQPLKKGKIVNQKEAYNFYITGQKCQN